jgi:ApaG protein
MKQYTATTLDITVTVQPVFLDTQSNAIAKKFIFAYFIRIANSGTDEVQLLRRHWYINDGSKNTTEVEGDGVVGRQPVIQPGQFHEYNSFCVLETMEGSREGTYQMKRNNGEPFDAIIPRFSLRAYAN